MVQDRVNRPASGESRWTVALGTLAVVAMLTGVFFAAQFYLSEVVAQRRSSVAALEQEINSLQSRLGEVLQERERLRAEQAILTQRPTWGEIQKTTRQQLARVESLAAMLEELRVRLAEREERITALERQLATTPTSDTPPDALRQRLLELQAERDDLARALAERDRRLEAQSQKLTDIDQQMNTLLQSQDTVLRALAARDKELQALRQQSTP